MPKTYQLQYPSLGVVRRFGLRDSTGGQGPFGSPYSMNCRLEDSLTVRLRGGSFTGISAGSRPSLIYRDRLLTFSNNAISASRKGFHTDLDFDVDISDTARATVFQFAEDNDTGSDVVALAPHKDQFLIGWTASETWVQQGDPLTGPRRRVSDQVGIIGADAWCVNHDTVYFLSSRGLYSVNADGSGLKALSEDKVPEDLTGVSDSDCTLTYQHSDRGVYIHNTGTDWFYDTERDGFWPFNTDETDSHVLLGPFQLGLANAHGRVLNLHGNIAASSTDVAWRIVTGDTAEEAADNGKAAITAALAGSSYSSYVKSSGTWSAGRAHMAYPRTRAIFMVLWLSSTGSWAYETAALVATASGKWR